MRSRDPSRLRRRRARSYVGPWLPSPNVIDPSEAWIDTGRETTAARYEQLESVTYAFLVALEVSSPRQRAVLLLRDAFDHDTQQTAEAIGRARRT